MPVARFESPRALAFLPGPVVSALVTERRGVLKLRAEGGSSVRAVAEEREDGTIRLLEDGGHERLPRLAPRR